MQSFLTLFLFDIVLGFIPQAMGCVICLFAFTKQPLKSQSFLTTSVIFSAIAVGVRLICNYGLIDFGFHTILIWLIFVIVAIMYNRLPALQSTISIMLSGVLIVVTEVITALALTIILGTEEFNAMMDNTATVEGQITRAAYGIPMNMLFVLAALLLYYLIKKRNERRAAKTENA